MMATDVAIQYLETLRADIDSVPFPEMPELTPVQRVCGCGAAMVAMVYRQRPNGLSVFEAKCRDHKAVTA